MLDEPEDLTDEYLTMKGYPRDESGGWVLPPKYYTSPGFPKGRVIYNFDQARKLDIGVVSEGTFDVASIGPAGMATLGKSITEYQARLLKTYFNRVVIALDPDASKESKAIVNNLRMSIDVHELHLEGEDPGDMQTEDIWRKISAGLEHNRNLHQANNPPTTVMN
jgi:DNA primase